MKQFNINQFEGNLELAVKEIVGLKMGSDRIRCRMETKKNDESIKIYVIDASTIVGIVNISNGEIERRYAADKLDGPQDE